MKSVVAVVCFLHIFLTSVVSGVDPATALALADKGMDVANKGIDTAKKLDEFLWNRINSQHDAVAKPPDDLISSATLDAALKNLGKAKDIKFEPMPGFAGINDFQPAGWSVKQQTHKDIQEPEGEESSPSYYPAGVGFALMNGCIGTDYQPGDPCYASKRLSTKCLDQIDAANFIGVGFDGRGTYSADSRKMSIIQRSCKGKASFADKDIPDNMNAFGIYDYSVNTETYGSTDSYMKSISSKAATSTSTSIFSGERAKFSRAESYSYGLFGGAKGGVGWGVSSEKKESEDQKDYQTSQSIQSKNQNQKHFIAILSVELKLFEITLDAVTPDDLAIYFLHDFLKLPNSYYAIGADAKFQSFVLRYGTHFVRAAKFGGQLKVIKTSTSDSSMTSDEFATVAETEFKAMTSTLTSSYQQGEDSTSFLGSGEKKSFSNQNSKATGNSKESKEHNSKNNAQKAISSSEFMKTEMEVTGGNPEIAVAIMDFYKPQFRNEYDKWLQSIPDYAKPFEFTLGQNSKILDINIDSLFTDENSKVGCFSSEKTKFDDKKQMYYFLEPQRVNGTQIGVEKHYCTFGNDKDKFMQDFASRRLSLERAENVYMVEGAFSTTSFEIHAGDPGCESNILNYKGREDKQLFPSWENMKSDIFKVVFQLPFDLPFLSANAEVIVRLIDDMWFYKNPGGSFKMTYACPSFSNHSNDHVFCVAGLQLKYDEHRGFFKLNPKQNRESSVVQSLGTQLFIGRVLKDTDEIISQPSSTGFLHNVPCSVKWSNSHRINPSSEKTCIHFSAASAGNIYVIFAEVPNDHNTWYYLQLSQNGVQFYERMLLRKEVRKLGIGTLGDRNLFETYFVCVNQGKGNLKIMYGKAPATRQIGEVKSSFSFPNTDKQRVSFYTFGSGEEIVNANDVRVINEYPEEIQCTEEGSKMVNGDCDVICHAECQGCHHALDAKSCTSCKNFQVDLSENTFECISECPAKKEPMTDTKIKRCRPCPVGTSKKESGNQNCTPCAEGTFQNKIGQSDCKLCMEGEYEDGKGSKQCSKCPAGAFSKQKGNQNCTLCSEGSFQNEIGQSDCNSCMVGEYVQGNGNKQCLKCKKNTFNNKVGQSSCIACPGDLTSLSGSKSCNNTCSSGTYLQKSACKKSPVGHFVVASGSDTFDACPNGKYQDQTGQSSCKACGLGKYQDASGKTTCKNCPPGYYQNIQGQSSCKKCSAGQYQNEKGQSFCKKCPVGQYQIHTGQRSCKTCGLGKYQDASGKTTCKNCPPEYYQNIQGQSFCKKCPVGQYQIHTGQRSCKKCTDGTYQQQLPYNGKAGATSVFNSKHSAQRAFQGQGGEYWANKARVFPATVWYKFANAVTLSKIRLTTNRNKTKVYQTPRAFKVVGSDDCSTWNTMLTVRQSGFNAASQTKEWTIPCRDQTPYRCVGVTFLSTITSQYTNKYVSITNIKMFQLQLVRSFH